MTHHDAEPAGRSREVRTADDRLADHAAIDRLAADLLPALIAKLGASGLGELDVREGAWRVRLRMPVDGRGARRAPGRGAGRADGHAARTEGPAAGGGLPPGHAAPGAAAGGHAAGTGVPPKGSPPHQPAPDGRGDDADADEAGTVAIATSPAVGFFRSRADLPPGSRVRAGDRLGTVDVLGVPQEVVAPADGIVGASFVEPGEPVEYGQDIVEIELLDAPAGQRAGGA